MNFNFDTNSLLVATLFSTIGLGMFLYGKKQARPIPLIVGLALMVIPFFIANLWWQSGVCVALLGVSFAMRERL